MAIDQQLLDAYLDEELTTEKAGELQRLLHGSDEFVDEFVCASFFRQSLCEIARCRLLQTNVQAEQAQYDRLALTVGDLSNRKSIYRQQRRWRQALSAAAAIIFVAVALRLAGWNFGFHPVVAQLTKASPDLAWDDQMASRPAAGQFLREGQRLNLRDGRLLITFSSGAQVCVQGPAQLYLTGENSMHLEAGRLSAVVPGQAIGFVVETKLGKVRDMGTEFVLHLNRPDALRLFVFTGLVKFLPATEIGGKPVSVSESRAIEVSGKTGEVSRASFDGVEFYKL
jgi:ferric-dicitrate binding protein FerR (iron transport regulator)